MDILTKPTKGTVAKALQTSEPATSRQPQYEQRIKAVSRLIMEKRTNDPCSVEFINTLENYGM